jgi:RNA polymerase sigma-70 factor (ECF subfamily)
MILPLQPAVSEEELVARLQASDRAAISLLYRNYSAALYGVILRIVRCEETAEDALQDTFLKVWTSFASYSSTRGRLFTWLLHIARNTALDVLRTQHFRKGTFTQGISESGTLVRHTAHYPFNPDCMDVRRLTEMLRPEQKEIIELMYFGGYSQSEIAEELRLPLGTVKTRARSAIQALRGLFTLKLAQAC